MDYIVIFYIHSGAIKFERLMKQIGIPVMLMPVPRKFSSSCGIAARVKYNGDIRNIIIADIKKIFVTKEGKSMCIYNSELDI